jgi:hypothetical protein
VYISEDSSRYCNWPHVGATAKYQDGKERYVNSRTLSFAEQNPDGTFKPASLPLFGGRTYRASITYNDGSSASGGGGNAWASTTFVMPKEKLEGFQFYNPDTPKVITFPFTELETPLRPYNNIETWRREKPRLTQPLCYGIQPASNNSADLRLTGGYSAIGVYPQSKPGDYTIQAFVYWTGMGTLERFTAQTKVRIERRYLSPKNLIFTGPADKTIYGSGSFSWYWVSEDKQIVPVKNPDYEIVLKRGEEVIDMTGNTPQRIKTDYYYNSNDFIHHLWFTDRPKSMGLDYSLSVKHKPTGTTASHSYQTIGSWESTDAQASDPPLKEPPQENETIHPACERYYKNPTGLEFAAGTGARNDPFVICDIKQLKALGQTHLGNNYCRQSGVQCTGILNKDYTRLTNHIILGASLDFKGELINPILPCLYVNWGSPTRWGWGGFILDGQMRSISNYVIVDSEKDYMALFSETRHTYQNLIIRNPTVRGRKYVAALLANSAMDLQRPYNNDELEKIDISKAESAKQGLPYGLNNIHVIGGVVIGESHIGGAAVGWEALNEIGVYGTQVRYGGGGSIAGGVTPGLISGNKLFFSGTISPYGVSWSLKYLGGIAGVNMGRLTNTLMTGKVISPDNNSCYYPNNNCSSTGGVVGINRGHIINSQMSGLVVTRGGLVGGIAGANEWHGASLFGQLFGLDIKHPLYSRSRFPELVGIIRAEVDGSVWGSASAQEYECLGRIVPIIGVGGYKSCLGEQTITPFVAGAAGGIIGFNQALIQDSKFTGVVRGTSVVGGITGFTASTNLVRNESAGTVSGSSGASTYGALVGRDISDIKLPLRLDSNKITPGEGNPNWAIGSGGGKFTIPTVSNVPELFDR